MRIKKSKLIYILSALSLGAASSIVGASAASAGQTDICSSTSVQNSSAYATGTTRYTAEQEDIWWSYYGDVCSGYTNPSGIIVRLNNPNNGTSTSAVAIAPGQMIRVKLENQYPISTAYRLQWRNSPARTVAKWHFEL